MAKKWFFFNRLLLGDKPLLMDDQVQILSEDGPTKVQLEKALVLNDPKVASLILRGTGYSSSDEAHSAGRLWRQFLAMTLADGGVGVDLDPLPFPSHGNNARPRDPAAPGLYVHPGGLHAHAIFGGHAARPMERVISDLATVREAVPKGFPNRPDLELAFRMVNLSWMLSNVDAQYILLVTAIEALIPDTRPVKTDAGIIAALDELAAYVKSADRFSGSTRQKLLSILADDKRQSVTEIGVNLARRIGHRTYDGLKPEEYFRRAYGIRSSLVHGGLKKDVPIDREMMAGDMQVLRRFVADLLAVETGRPLTN